MDIGTEALAVRLVMPDETRREIQPRGVIAIAKAFEVVDALMAQVAADERREAKARKVWLEERRDKFVEPAMKILAEAKALFQPAIDENEEAIQIYGQKLVAFDTEMKRKATEEKRIREETERKARQDAEAKAAAERAAAEQKAADLRRQAAAAEETRKKAEEEGRRRAAQTAAADAAKLRQEADAAIESGESKAAAAHILSAATLTASAPIEETKITGFSTRANWKARFKPGLSEEEVHIAICGAVSDPHTSSTYRRALLELVPIDWKAAHRWAKAQKLGLSIPGMEAFDDRIAESRG